MVERDANVGGQLQLARLTPHRQEFGDLDWLAHEVRRLGVRVELDRPVDDDLIEAVAPDAALVGDGSRARRYGRQNSHPNHRPPGIDLPHVVTGRQVVAGKAPRGVCALVIDDTGLTRHSALRRLSSKTASKSISLLVSRTQVRCWTTLIGPPATRPGGTSASGPARAPTACNQTQSRRARGSCLRREGTGRGRSDRPRIQWRPRRATAPRADTHGVAIHSWDGADVRLLQSAVGEAHGVACTIQTRIRPWRGEIGGIGRENASCPARMWIL